jgi:Cu-processing system permease protein
VTGVWIMASVTFREAARKKILWCALGAGLGFVALFAAALHFQARDFDARDTVPFLRYQIDSAMLLIGLYVVDLLAVVMTILTSVETISGEIATGTIQAIAMKPVPRWQILAGKWIGFAVLVAAFVLLTFGGTVLAADVIAGVVPEHAVAGALLIYLECLITLGLTFLCGTWVSTLASGVLVIGLQGVALMGGWLEQMSGFTESAQLAMVGVVTSLVVPGEALWRRAAYDMQTPLAGALPFSPFASVSIPSRAMVVYAVLYLIAILLAAVRRFGSRDL